MRDLLRFACFEGTGCQVTEEEKTAGVETVEQ